MSQDGSSRDTLLSENFQNASFPPLKKAGFARTGDKFGQSQKGKSGRNLIMVRQNFNFISESGDLAIPKNFITGQREETTQNTIVTKSRKN
jgi:hypothetical protein